LRLQLFFILSGTNIYTGTTTINTGKLSVTGATTSGLIYTTPQLSSIGSGYTTEIAVIDSNGDIRSNFQHNFGFVSSNSYYDIQNGHRSAIENNVFRFAEGRGATLALELAQTPPIGSTFRVYTDNVLRVYSVTTLDFYIPLSEFSFSSGTHFLNVLLIDPEDNILSYRQFEIVVKGLPSTFNSGETYFCSIGTTPPGWNPECSYQATISGGYSEVCGPLNICRNEDVIDEHCCKVP